MVKDHSDIAREETRSRRHMFYYFQCIFYKRHLTDRTIHTTAFVTRVVEHWLEQDIFQWLHLEGQII